MSFLRRFRVAAAIMVAVFAVLIGSGAAAGANPTAPTVPVTSTDGGVSSRSAGGVSGASSAAPGQAQAQSQAQAQPGSASDPQVLSSVLAQTGSSTGLMVITGIILLVVGGSLIRSRQVYGS